MFTKLRPRQERFLWLVVEGVSQTQAYKEAYGNQLSDMSCAVSASKMLKLPKVLARRQELIAQRHARAPISQEFLTRELLAVSGEARALGQTAAATQALLGVAKLHGLLVDNVKLDALVRKPSSEPGAPDEMSEAEWLSKYTRTIDLQPAEGDGTIVPHEDDSIAEYSDEDTTSTILDST